MCKGCHLAIYEKFSRTEDGAFYVVAQPLLDLGWLSQRLISSTKNKSALSGLRA